MNVFLVVNVLRHRVDIGIQTLSKSVPDSHTREISNMAAPVIACMITCLSLTLPHLLYFKGSQPYFLGLTEQS